MTPPRIRKILHLDLDAFFCAVEEFRDPSLAGKAFAVGGSADHRGVISSCSYPARKKGVHSAMPTGQALRLCPELILVSHGFGDYSTKSDEVMAILRNISGLVEQISVDEAFVDITDLPDTIETIARQIQTEVLQLKPVYHAPLAGRPTSWSQKLQLTRERQGAALAITPGLSWLFHRDRNLHFWHR